MKKGFLVLTILFVILLTGTAMAATAGTYGELMTALNDPSVTTIDLTGTIVAERMINIKRPVVINGHGFSIIGNDTFDQADPGFENDDHLFQIYQTSGVTLKNLTLSAGSKNKHTLNVFESKNVVLDNVTLKHAGYKGAALVVNLSEVSVRNDVTFTLGTSSWYAVNVAKGTQESANAVASPKLAFEESAQVAFNAPADKPFAQISDTSSTIIPNSQMEMDSVGQGFFTLHVHKYTNGVCICGDKLPVVVKNVPRTGDESQLLLWAALMLCSACVLVVLNRKMQHAR